MVRWPPQRSVAKKLCLLHKARLGGEETGAHSALLIYLIQFVGGLGNAGGYNDKFGCLV